MIQVHRLLSTIQDCRLSGVFNPYKPSVPFLGHWAECGVWSGSSLFANRNIYSKQNKNEKVHQTHLKLEMDSSNIDKDGQVHSANKG